MLLFKGKPFGRVEKKRIQKNPLVKSIQIFAYCKKKFGAMKLLWKNRLLTFGKSILILIKKSTMLV